MNTVTDRFWSKVVKTDSCWKWTGCKKDGYGRINRGARGLGSDYAHRVSWLMHNGAIPEGLCVLHRCDNPECTNPGHLFLGTKKDNSRDMISKKRGAGHFTSGVLDSRSNGGRYNKVKTSCPKGHPYSGSNLYISASNRRNCRACSRDRARRNRNENL